MNDQTDNPGPLGAATHAELLASLLREAVGAGITELEVSFGSLRVFLRRRPQRGAQVPPIAAAAQQESAVDESWAAITTPLAGVFYARESPDAEPYAHVGSTVSTGQPVGLIEAMKTFNQVLCEVTGVVRQIIVATGDTVQPGQILMYVEPDERVSLAPPAL